MQMRGRLAQVYMAQGVKGVCQDATLVRYRPCGTQLDRVAVFDGVSFGKLASGGTLAAHAAMQAFQKRVPLRKAAKIAQKAIREAILDKGLDITDPRECFATTAIAVDLDFDNRVMHWLYIGDGLLLVINKDGSWCEPAIRPKQDEAMHSALFNLRGKGLSIQQKRKEVDSHIAAARFLANREASGFSLLNGDPRVLQVMQQGVIRLDEVAHVIMATDGLEFMPTSLEEKGVERFVSEIAMGGGLGDIHRKIREQFKEADYHEKIITEKRGHDDAAGIHVMIGE